MTVVRPGASAAVVVEINDQRVVQLVLFANRLEHAADRRVHRVHHRCINTPIAIRDIVVLGDHLFRCLQRGVRRAERQVEEKRLRAVAPLNQPDRLVGQQVGRVPLLVHRFAIAHPVKLPAAGVGVRVVINETTEKSVVMIEPTPVRHRGFVRHAQVPFAGHERLVARRLERLRQDELLHRQRLGTFPDRRQDAVADRRAPGHQRHASRAADRVGIKPIQLDPLRHEPIQIRRPDLAAVKADILPAHVVGNDQHHVGLCFRGFRGEEQAGRHGKQHQRAEAVEQSG